MSLGHTILISTVHSSSFLWLYSHTLVSSRTFNRGPSRRRPISAGDSYQSGPGVDGGMEENPFHLPSDFHSICSLPPPPLFNPIFLSTAEFSEREHYVRDRSSSPFLKQTRRHVFVFPPLHSFFFFSYHCLCNTLLGEGAKSTAEDGLTVRLREAQVFGNRLLWNKFQDNPPVMLILCLRVVVECFGCVHRQSRKSTFSQGSVGVYLRLAWLENNSHY